MLLRASDQKNMHVAHFPEMCLFTTEIIFPSEDDAPGGQIIVTFHPPTPNDFSPSHTAASSLTVPLQPEVEDLDEVKVTMHSSSTVGFDMGKHYNDWFSERFGYGVTLLYIGKNRREVLGNMSPNVAGRQRQLQEAAGASAHSWISTITSVLPSIPWISANEATFLGVDEGISFADCAPYLVISTKSWENVQSRLPPTESLDISKFRANIIVEGATEAFEEDYWAELEIASSPDKENAAGTRTAKLVLTQNCARCNSLNIDYSTGKVGRGEAGKILKKLQSDRRVDPGAKYSPIFGRYGFLDRIPGTGLEVRVGDEVCVVKRNGARTKFGTSCLFTSQVMKR
jgi:uncharacterized protein YcbX